MTQDDVLDNYTIITAIDKNYLKIFSLWLKYFANTGYLKCLKVITFDKESEAFIKKNNITFIRANKKITQPRDIYVFRLEEIKNELKSGKHVIHTDSDAFWLKPDLPAILKTQFDLQISIGHGIPKRAIKQWGFSLCCGFFVFHTNAKTIGLFDTWIQKSIEMNHDQNALNEIFLDSKTTWELNSNYYNVGYSQVLDMHIEAINYEIISRLTDNKKIQVYHPYLPGRYEQVKLFNLIPKLKQFGNHSFLQPIYLKQLFNVTGWGKAFFGRIKEIANK